MTPKVDKASFAVQEFAHKNAGLIVITLDPKSDQIHVCFKNKMVRGTIKSAKTGKPRVIRKLLTESQFNEGMDGLTVSLLDAFKVSLRLPSMNQVLKNIDGALFNISKSLRARRPTEAVRPLPGAVKSPLEADAEGRVQGDL